jgi:hypothetical protein
LPPPIRSKRCFARMGQDDAGAPSPFPAAAFERNFSASAKAPRPLRGR